MYTTVEQLLPPEIMPQQRARSVGVINNFSKNNVIIVNDKVGIFPCDADSVKDHIALAFADA